MLNNNKNGYVALFSTIILSAIFAVIFISMFTLSVGGMKRMSDTENSFQAVSLANVCAEKMLMGIREDKNYFLGVEDPLEISVTTNGICSIESVKVEGGTGSNFRSANVRGVFLEYEKELIIDIFIKEEGGVRNIEIVGWREE